ncbi:heme exporter protein CcmD [Halomonas sp. Bachu 37]|uniref:heme exporter protein CcmD n=1 Tax=Halomonas kashgarensis TaxID=3084920 RepID=UPI003217D15C
MAFDTLREFFAMGGHAAYVWASWGATALLLLGTVVHAFGERRQLLTVLKRRQRRERVRHETSPSSEPLTTAQGGDHHDA